MLFLIIFHKNVYKFCEKEWIQKCIKSIEEQTFQKFDIFELNYGNDNNSIKKFFSDDFLSKHNYEYIEKELEDHSYAMNYIINYAMKYEDRNYKYIGNVNLDDYYHKDRLKLQIEKLNTNEFDLVSNNMQYIKSDGKFYKKLILTNHDSQKVIDDNFKKNHNIVAHPSVMYTVDFFKKVGPYTNTVPREDFDLWIKARKMGMKISILNKCLLFYRLHKNQVSRRKK